MVANAADYGWISEWCRGLFHVAYCLTMVRGLPREELLDRLHVGDRTLVLGAEATVIPAMDAWSIHGGSGCYVGATDVGAWAVMLEPNGWIGARRDVVLALSEARTVVSHYRNVNALDSFYWAEDGALRLHFEPLFPTRREGTHAEEIVPAMRAVGFDLREGDQRSFAEHTEAAFALGEYLTGQRLTPELLDGSSFLCGIAPLPEG